MEERNVINGVAATTMGGMMEFIYPLKWMALLGLVLIIADMKFGISASRYRGDKIRFSRAIRRTINKMVDYTCWMLLAATMDRVFGLAFDFPLLPFLIMLVVYGVEINSCFANYFEAKGKNIKINIFDIFKSKNVEIEEKNTNK